VLRFEDGTHLDLDEDSFLTLSDVDVRDHLAPKGSYLLFGYPASKSRVNVATRHLTAEPFRFVGYAVPPRRYFNAGVTHLTHLALDFNIRKSASKFGIGRAPKPLGVSGGGIWSVPALADPRLVGEAKLVAIFTEFQRVHRLLIGSRLHYHFEIMRARWPDIASLLPGHGLIDLQTEHVEPRTVDP
jgi:hypothetical protein